jgi:hypothetical protein
MRIRLDPILSPFEFSRAELSALRLDGEVYAVVDCVVPLDEVVSPILRALALARELPPRLIAEQHTAAWVWGALESPPPRHEVCANTTSRTRPALRVRLNVREVVIEPDAVSRLGPLELTTPIRTAIDLARCVENWSTADTTTLANLMQIGRFAPEDCEVIMNRRRNLPAKRLALERLRFAHGRASLARINPVHVVDRVDTPNGIQYAVEVGRIPHLEHETAEREAVA